MPAARPHISPQHANADHSTQAMTEVALGLSMAFFALLILALISMGSGLDAGAMRAASSDEKHDTNADASLRYQKGIYLEKELTPDLRKDAEQMNEGERQESKRSTLALKDNQLFIVFANEQFFDANLQPIKPEQLANDQSLVLAVSPELSFDKLLTLKSRFTQQDIHITALNEQWLNALAQRHDAGFP